MYMITKERFNELGLGWDEESCNACIYHDDCVLMKKEMRESDDICPEVDDDRLRDEMTVDEYWAYRHNMMFIAQQPLLMRAFLVTLYNMQKNGANIRCAATLKSDAPCTLSESHAGKVILNNGRCWRVDFRDIQSVDGMQEELSRGHVICVTIKMSSGETYIIATEELLNFDMKATGLTVSSTLGDIIIPCRNIDNEGQDNGKEDRIMEKNNISVMDFIDNNIFDVNCYCNIYDCTGDVSWHEARLVATAFSHDIKGDEELLRRLSIKYVTVSEDRIIIEATL